MLRPQASAGCQLEAVSTARVIANPRVFGGVRDLLLGAELQLALSLEGFTLRHEGRVPFRTENEEVQ
jgi:hypothetical protein